MANEISYTITVTYSNPNFNIPSMTFASGSDSISIADEPGPYQRNVVNVTVTQTAIPLSLVSTLGPCMLHNCDSTNAISVYATASDTNALLTINPGESQFVRFAQTAVPSVACVAGSPLLEYWAISN